MGAKVWILPAIAISIFLSILPGDVAAADLPFVRGDANRDGRVTVADYVLIDRYVEGWLQEEPACLDAFDYDDDGVVEDYDANRILDRWGDREVYGVWYDPTAPFPEAGADPTPDALGCADAGPFPAIADDGALFWGEEVTIGADDERSVSVRIFGVPTVDLYAAELRLALSPLVGAVFDARNGVDFFGKTRWVNTSPGQCNFMIARLVFPENPSPIVPAGEDACLGVIGICFPPGTPAGTYELGIVDAEYAGLDGRARIPTIVSPGRITIESDLQDGDCRPADMIADTLDGFFPRAGFRVGSTEADPGDPDIALPVWVVSQAPIRALDVAIDFNEYVLRAVHVDPSLQVAGQVPDFFDVKISNTVSTILNDRQEGWVAIRAILSEPGSPVRELQPMRYHKVARLHFSVSKEVPHLYRTFVRCRTVGPAEDRHGNSMVVADSTTGQDRTTVFKDPDDRSTGPADGSILIRGPEVPVPANLDDAQLVFALGDAEAAPGDQDVPIGFYVTTNVPVMGLVAAVRYDPKVLTCRGGEARIHFLGEKPEWFRVDVNPTFGGAVLGLVNAISATKELGRILPVGETSLIGVFKFDVSPEAEVDTETPLTLGPVMLREGLEVVNYATVQGVNLFPDPVPSRIELRPSRTHDGVARILGDVAIFFVRGDATGDMSIDMADPIRILNYLFVAGTVCKCEKAADVNDDSKLDVADAIGLLMYIFAGGKPPAWPYPMPGRDPTPDLLSCWSGIGRIVRD